MADEILIILHMPKNVLAKCRLTEIRRSIMSLKLIGNLTSIPITVPAEVSHGSIGAGQHFQQPTVKIERQVWRKCWACNAAERANHERQVPGDPVPPVT